MRVITFNVNGIRSAERRGFARWLARVEGWDVVCLQELKAHADDVPKCLRAPRKCHASFHPAQRKGYAGVGIYARAPATFSSGFGSREFDGEGRYLRADFRDLSVISLYLPSGSAGPHRQASKFRFLEEFLPHLGATAHVGTRDHPVRRLEHRAPGDRPHELAQQPEELGLPARRARVAHRACSTTWASSTCSARSIRAPSSTRGGRTAASRGTKNVGWRIDYQIATPGIAQRARAVSIYKNRRFSDHAPLIVDYDFELR